MKCDARASNLRKCETPFLSGEINKNAALEWEIHNHIRSDGLENPPPVINMMCVARML